MCVLLIANKRIVTVYAFLIGNQRIGTVYI